MLDQLQRAVAVVLQVHALQSLVTMLGVLPADARARLPAPIDRFDDSMLHAVQADPMWPIANRLVLRPRNYIDTLAVAGLFMLRGGLLDSWEAYHDRLVRITTPTTTSAA